MTAFFVKEVEGDDVIVRTCLNCSRDISQRSPQAKFCEVADCKAERDRNLG